MNEDPRPEGVEGWLTAEQAGVLAAAAAACPADGEIVEIGSFRGLSTIVLAAHAPESASVVAIDPHAGNDRGPGEISGYADAAASDRVVFERNLVAAGVRHRVRHVPVASADAHAHVGGAIDVLYIDGAHRYAAARADIRDWGGRVADGGTLLIHDAFSSVGVTLAVMRGLLLGRRFRYVGRSRTLVEYRADLPATGLPGAVANVARQLAVLPYFVWNLGLKALLVVLMARSPKRATLWPY